MTFIWLFVVPLSDVTYAVAYYAAGHVNDLHDVFGAPRTGHRLAAAVWLLLAFLWGYRTQKRLYGTAELALSAYVLLFIGAFVGLQILIATRS
jgi:hypothetical protein